ncbi:hypothetical protein K439DRAFT_1620295 [Ramaria rubella]|nr:hypothetical protein K439DRAFT_1620295 [Ramaria rubella]
MSSQEEVAALIQEQSDNMAQNYVFVAALTLLAYDTLLTFPYEVKFIWHKKFRLGTILYLLACYPTRLRSLLDGYLGFANFPSLQTYNALDVLPAIGVQGLLFARAYAISGHHKLVFVVLALLGTTAIVLSMISIPNNNCISSSNIFALCKMFNLILRNRLWLFQFLKAQWNSYNFRGESQAPKKLSVTIAHPASNLLSCSAMQGLRPTLQGILGTLQNSLSVILICRFHLDLQQRNEHPNGSITSHSLPLGSFHAVTERIHRAVVDEFGDLSFNESFGTEASQEDIELQDMQSPSAAAEIDLQEFPWAGGDIGDEEAGPVASGSGILME